MDRIRTALDVMPDPAVVTDERGTILAINDEAEDLLGYHEAELVGRKIEALVPEGLVAAHRGHRSSYHGQPRRRRMGSGLEIRARRKDGSQLPVDISLSPVLTEDGLLVVAALRDVSERKLVEEMKDAFLTAVSHELRTPLTAVIGIAQTLERNGDQLSPEERSQMHRLLVHRAEKLDRLLADLLDLDRLTRGAATPHVRPTNLGQLVQGVLSDTELNGHRVEVAVEPIVILADGPKVERIIENLVVNAAKHTPKAARIWLKASRVEGGVLMQVEDEGPGVPDDLKVEIFEPFHRGSVPSHQPGTGVGLALVERFARLHGGRAWVEDRPGGGASFAVFLPSEVSLIEEPRTRTFS